jgi:plasmid stabilization system protein ParE
MKLRIAKSAVTDLQAIQAQYKDQGVPHIGNDFVTAIVQHIEILQPHPDAGRVVAEFNQENIRELTHTPFRLVYLRQAQEIVFIRVWRSERLPALPDSKI